MAKGPNKSTVGGIARFAASELVPGGIRPKLVREKSRWEIVNGQRIYVKHYEMVQVARERERKKEEREEKRMVKLLCAMRGEKTTAINEDAVDARFRVGKLLQAKNLNPRERQVIELRFGLNGNRPHSLKELAGKLNVTSERVRQIEARALRILRKRAEGKVNG